MIPKIKICGLTRLQDAELAITLGAQYLGFIFAKNTPREVNPTTVRNILQALRSKSKASDHSFFTVGVFLSETPAEIQQNIHECQLDYAQVHAAVTPEHRNIIQVPVIPAVRMKDEDSVNEATEHLTHGPVLLDTYAPNQHGGTGKTFRHELAFPLIPKGRVMIAGGLNAENISEVYTAFRQADRLPFAFDLSSGVEAEPRIKSGEKLQAFFRNYQRVAGY